MLHATSNPHMLTNLTSFPNTPPFLIVCSAGWCRNSTGQPQASSSWFKTPQSSAAASHHHQLACRCTAGFNIELLSSTAASTSSSYALDSTYQDWAVPLTTSCPPSSSTSAVCSAAVTDRTVQQVMVSALQGCAVQRHMQCLLFGACMLSTAVCYCTCTTVTDAIRGYAM